MKHKISVIIPAYNAEEDLKVLIEALKNQTVQPYEYLLVDDCSTDNTKKVAEEFFTVISMPTNAGPAAARNLGMRKAKGDYFAFLDSDCIPKTDWVEQIAKCIDNNDDEVITGGVFVNAKTFLGKSIAALGFPAGGALGFDKMWRVSPEGYVEKISSGNLVVKRSVIEKFKGFDESFSYCFEDAWLAQTLLKNGYQIKYCPAMNVEHKPTESLKAFIKWHYSRGKGLKPFKERVGKLGKFKKLRLWSTKNMIKAYYKDVKFPLIITLFGLSVVLQYVAFYVEKFRDST